MYIFEHQCKQISWQYAINLFKSMPRHHALSSTKIYFTKQDLILINLIFPFPLRKSSMILCLLSLFQRLTLQSCTTGAWQFFLGASSLFAHVKVEDGTWTFEHEFLKKLLISNVYLKEMPLAGHLYRVMTTGYPGSLTFDLWPRPGMKWLKKR